ncbi:hypothetical protein [Streptomyces globosus]|uniref:hypothetical protein n=1 Tax=Streptomyces globosus TaxID=68209 RepID=UPI00381ECA9D
MRVDCEADAEQSADGDAAQRPPWRGGRHDGGGEVVLAQPLLVFRDQVRLLGAVPVEDPSGDVPADPRVDGGRSGADSGRIPLRRSRVAAAGGHAGHDLPAGMH